MSGRCLEETIFLWNRSCQLLDPAGHLIPLRFPPPVPAAAFWSSFYHDGGRNSHTVMPKMSFAGLLFVGDLNVGSLQPILTAWWRSFPNAFSVEQDVGRKLALRSGLQSLLLYNCADVCGGVGKADVWSRPAVRYANGRSSPPMPRVGC